MADAEKEATRKWLSKALHDLESARKLVAGTDPILDTAIYHCQQAAEKAVKGFLTFHRKRFEKTHDIERLISMAAEVEPRYSVWKDAGNLLTPYASAFRYPDQMLEPDRAEFDEALVAAQRIYDFVLSTLPKKMVPSAGG